MNISQLVCIFHLISVLSHSLDDNLDIIIMVDNHVDYRATITYLSSQSSYSFNLAFLYLIYYLWRLVYNRMINNLVYDIIGSVSFHNIDEQAISK